MYKRYLIVVIGIVAVLFAAVGWGKAALNPYVYDKDAIATAAQGLAEGKNLADYDPNIDLRALRQSTDRADDLHARHSHLRWQPLAGGQI